jgi:hypothetical protein
MTMNIDEFKTTLAECSSELVKAYIRAGEEELEIRNLKEVEKIKETLQIWGKTKVKELILGLGFDWKAELAVPVAEKKTRSKRSMLPHGYKEYTLNNATYYVAPFFHPELKKISKGVKASWLENLSSSERLEQFSTVHLLTTGQITLTDLVAVEPDAVQMMDGETMQLVTHAMLTEVELNTPDASDTDKLEEAAVKAGKKGVKKKVDAE